MAFREDAINPFWPDKMVGIQEEEGGYRAFLGGVDLACWMKTKPDYGKYRHMAKQNGA